MDKPGFPGSSACLRLPELCSTSFWTSLRLKISWPSSENNRRVALPVHSAAFANSFGKEMSSSRRSTMVPALPSNWSMTPITMEWAVVARRRPAPLRRPSSWFGVTSCEGGRGNSSKASAKKRKPRAGPTNSDRIPSAKLQPETQLTFSKSSFVHPVSQPGNMAPPAIPRRLMGTCAAAEAIERLSVRTAASIRPKAPGRRAAPSMLKTQKATTATQKASEKHATNPKAVARTAPPANSCNACLPECPL
mmetsp:Transcript_72099/g.168740  ORF Transcript_72099/g.168740 Transcript_72099/m.168740 type:complete len:249 (-) Transcript_72099:1062-1808(-)